MFEPSGSYFAPKVTYSSVIGNSIQGKKLNKNIPFFDSPITTATLEGFAFHSYKTVCGDGNEIGDGVVPCCAGYLDGAIPITLEGVQHSHTYPGPWYGSSSVVNSWHDIMMNQLATKQRERIELKIETNKEALD